MGRNHVGDDVGARDRLVGRQRSTGRGGKPPRQRCQVAQLQARVYAIEQAQGRGELLERGAACAVPDPLTATSTTSAPARTPATLLASASPKSLWQCTPMGSLVTSRARHTSQLISSGAATPTESATYTVSAPASAAADHIACGRRARLASTRSGRTQTDRPDSFAQLITSRVPATASAAVMPRTACSRADDRFVTWMMSRPQQDTPRVHPAMTGGMPKQASRSPHRSRPA